MHLATGALGKQPEIKKWHRQRNTHASDASSHSLPERQTANVDGPGSVRNPAKPAGKNGAPASTRHIRKDGIVNPMGMKVASSPMPTSSVMKITTATSRTINAPPLEAP
ncbi:hypothetical protein [Pseudomonas lactis]|uniref:hypothetical protein n=1 Tax=Pseudomonas lactis TaxID=1615674 RepID=UPI001A084A92|nr:hypothetical protein [Pseudomonas lactis]MBA6043858.1 hypothetical protein [Pseudomonas lactis]